MIDQSGSIRIVADLHTHTLASGHAYSTLQEMARAAADKGLAMLAATDHGPALPGAPQKYHFMNSDIWPDSMYGVRLLRGAEVNIVDIHGALDLGQDCLAGLDFVLAGFHFDTYSPGKTEAEYTAALLAAMDNPYIDAISHPGNPMYPIDYEAFVAKAVLRNILIEINNSSLSSNMRPGSHVNCDRIVQLAKRHGARLLVSSDAHISTEVGCVDACTAFLEGACVSPEQVLNTSQSAILDFLSAKGRRRFCR